MSEREPFVDIHCHLLPGLDDGASTLDDALAMAEMAVGDGIRTIVVTPHQLGSYATNSGAAVRAAAAEFQCELDRRRVPLRILPGADVRIEPDLLLRIRRGEVLTLADRGRYVLLELPHDVYVPLDRLLMALKSAELVGILSHPERNRGILNQPGVLQPLIERGCLLQITAGSLTGEFGPHIQRFSETLVKQGLTHFVSTDAHGPKVRPPLLAPAFRHVVDLVGHEMAMNLFCRNPAAVVAGGMVQQSPHRPTRPGWNRWLHRTFVAGRESA